MLTRSKKDQDKILMGLLSYSENCETPQDILEEIAWYEKEDNRHLFLYREDKASDYIGLLGVEETEDGLLILRIANLNPSYHNEGYTAKMLDELQEMHADHRITSTLDTNDLLQQWRKDRNS